MAEVVPANDKRVAIHRTQPATLVDSEIAVRLLPPLEAEFRPERLLVR